MGLQENHVDGPNGTAVSVANSGASGSAFASVNTAGMTLVYDTSQKMHGTASVLFDAPASGTSSSSLVFVNIGSTTASLRAYVRFSAFPSAATNIIQVFNASGQGMSLFNIRNAGDLGFSLTGSYANATQWSNVPLTLNKWYRLEATIVATASGGSILIQAFDGDSTTPLFTLNPTGLSLNDSSNGPLTRVQFGKNTSSPTIGDFWMDDLAIRDGQTPIGPYVPGAPSVIASSALSGASLALSATALTYDNATPTYAWSQTAGPAVSLSNIAAANPTATLTVAGTYTFKVKVTDDLGKTAEDSVTVTYTGSVTAPNLTGPATALQNQWVETVTGTPANGGTMSYAISPSAGVSQPAPGVFYGQTPTAATTYTVTATESGNPNTQQFRFTVPGQSTQLGGLRILVADNDQSAGGSFT